MRRCHRHHMLLVCLCLLSSGCYVPRGARQPILPQTTAEKRSRRAGSALAASKASKPKAADQAASAEPAPKQNADNDKEIVELMAEVAKVGNLDKATQQQLIADLKKTPREHWPMIVNMLRASQTQPAEIETVTEITQVVDDFVVIAPSKDTGANRKPPASNTVAAKPAESTNPVRLPTVDKLAAAPQTPVAADPLAISKHNVLRKSEPTPAQRYLSTSQANTDQPPLDPPHKSPTQGVQLATAEIDSPPKALPKHAAHAKPASWQAALDETIAMLEQGSTNSANGHDPAVQARLRMLYLASGRRSEANQEIPGVSEDAKAYWSEQMYALGLYLDDETTPNARQRATRAAHHARTAVYRLGQLGNLIVRNMALATAVQSFGVYDELREYRVAPNQEVILYAELENFSSEETAQGFHTSLKANYEILDRRGKKIAAETLGDSEEYCRNLRRDFFVAYSVIIPSDLYNGDEYTLRLNIEDAKSQRVGESIIKFRVQK
jgi:hypothetical protein